MNKDIRRI